MSEDTKSPSCPTSSSKAAFNTGAGVTGRTVRPLACCASTPFPRSSQPMSPASSPPFSADWHSETALQAFEKPAQPSLARPSSTWSICASASSGVRLTAFRRTGSTGAVPAPRQWRRRIWRTRILLLASSVLCRLAGGRPDVAAGCSAGPRRRQAPTSCPAAPRCLAALRRATLAARGLPRTSCGTAAAAASTSSSCASPAASATHSASPEASVSL
mmetsp:Transcript_91487/g.272999  ORF Transcript_91487/g.272999 Transcript_91487/m.272999 type:complete len:216 (-) Transcript_91487:363-1010(-)